MPALSSVLLVDDDPTNFLNKLLLTHMGIAEQVLMAENGEQAWRTLNQFRAAPANTACSRLILLDVNRPVLNGLAFLAAYAQRPLAGPPIVVVMLTTSLHPAPSRPDAGAAIAHCRLSDQAPLTREKVLALLQEHFAK